MKAENLEKALELNNELSKYRRKKELASKIDFKNSQDDTEIFVAIRGNFFDAEAHLPQQDLRDLLKVYAFFVEKKIKKLELKLKLLGVEND
jgi:protein subunit release factor A